MTTHRIQDMGVDNNLIRKSRTICAWCQKESGEEPKPGQSHGICEYHAKMLRDELKEMKEDNEKKQKKTP